MIVVKVGGAVWTSGQLGALAPRLADAAREQPLLVVPGGGPFADAVRAAGLHDALAHRLAILAMEQYAHVLADAIPHARTTRALAAPPVGRAAVLLPAALADEPALPASWDVTSDSIAVFVAARAGAREVTLLKLGDGGTDAWLPEAQRRFGVRAVVADASDWRLSRA